MGQGSETGQLLSGTLRGRVAVWIGLAVSALCASSVAQVQTASAYQVEAAYLYNFAKFTEWPKQSLPDGSSSLVIGVVGGDGEFIEVLKGTVTGKAIGTHILTVKHLSPTDDLRSCHLLFFPSSERKRIQAEIAGLGRASILLVGEEEGFLHQGGMINLVLENGRIRFEVDRASLDRANLHLSPKLLALAKVEPGSPQVQSEGSRKLMASVPPVYPEIAQKMSLKGAVHVQALVGRDGTVKEVKVIGGHPLLAEAVTKAVMKWRYEPATKETVVSVRFVFGQ
jgi:TonB family protein